MLLPFARVTPAAAAPRRLELTWLEDRLTPAVAFQFDYRYDTTGFFNDASHRAALERSGADLLSRLDGHLAALAPSGANTWSQVLTDPATGGEVRVQNPTVPADTLMVYVGGARSSAGEAAEGGPGGYQVAGGAGWQTAVATRGASGFSTWGGSVSFAVGINWYFGADPAGRTGSQTDFGTVATHELAHVLGVGTSDEWTALLRGDQFVGSHAVAEHGSAVPVSPDHAHFAQGTKSGGHAVSMQPVLDNNGRVGFSDLDYAALADIGWQVGSTSVAAAPFTPAPFTPTSPAAPTPTPTPAFAAVDPVPDAGRTGGAAAPAGADRLILASGPTAGTVQAYSTESGSLVAVGTAFRPFGDFGGAVRTATGDVNGDGTADWIVGTGPGGGSRVRVLDGRTFADVVPEFWAFEGAFKGGVYLAAGDFDGDGRAEIVITPDQSGGPRVRVVGVDGGRMNVRADFWGIPDPDFRGGARVAVGDLNHDGIPDLAVAAGFGGGPRVSLTDGRSVLTGGGKMLGPDFFAFDPSLRNGVYVAVGDTDGDGFGDLILGAGPGGGPRVLVLSGKALTLAGPQAALAQPIGNTFAGDPSQRGGVRVAAKDVNGDGTQEVIAGSGVGGVAYVLTAGSGYGVSAAVDPFGAVGLDGIYVG